MIPSLILQPLVENAVQHGIAKHRGQGFIEIKISKEDDLIKFIVHNNGSPKSLNNQADGIGLKITKDRLSAIYGSDYKLGLCETKQNSTQALIEIPIIKEAPE